MVSVTRVQCSCDSTIVIATTEYSTLRLYDRLNIADSANCDVFSNTFDYILYASAKRFNIVDIYFQYFGVCIYINTFIGDDKVYLTATSLKLK